MLLCLVIYLTVKMTLIANVSVAVILIVSSKLNHFRQFVATLDCHTAFYQKYIKSYKQSNFNVRSWLGATAWRLSPWLIYKIAWNPKWDIGWHVWLNTSQHILSNKHTFWALLRFVTGDFNHMLRITELLYSYNGNCIVPVRFPRPILGI